MRVYLDNLPLLWNHGHDDDNDDEEGGGDDADYDDDDDNDYDALAYRPNANYNITGLKGLQTPLQKNRPQPELGL